MTHFGENLLQIGRICIEVVLPLMRPQYFVRFQYVRYINWCDASRLRDLTYTYFLLLIFKKEVQNFVGPVADVCFVA